MPAPLLYASRYWFAMSTHVCNVLSIDFFKTSRFDCCFWSTQCFETQARKSDNVKTGVFTSLNVQWMSFLDNFVYCNILPSLKAAFFELEKAMFTGSALLPMFNIITPGPYTHSKQSKAIHAKCNLKVECAKKMGFWYWCIVTHCCLFYVTLWTANENRGLRHPKAPTRYNLSKITGTCTLVDSWRGFWVT